MSDFMDELRSRIEAEDARHNDELRKVLAPPAPKRRAAAAELHPSDTTDDADELAGMEAMLKTLKKPRKTTAKSGTSKTAATPRKKPAKGRQ